MTRNTILVVDDEPSICWAFERLLGADGHTVVTASSAEDGVRLAAKHHPDLVLLDVRLPHESGIEALPRFLKATHNAPVIVMTAFGDLETAVAAVKNGASDYLTKPFKLEEASRACQVALNRVASTRSAKRSVPLAAAARSIDHSTLVGASAAMQQVFRQIALVAESDLSVLITGETGTGKELVAAAIHRHSHRSGSPYLPIAPVALNPDLVESELFGHVAGAFTGAIEDRAGLFERAEAGTVLLDEIGDLPLGTQVKLLRVLEQGQYTRVGDVTPRHANVRVLAATNCDLHQAVDQGQFREDLYHRLTGMQIHLPPLRERTDDIAPLCQHFLTVMDYPNAATAMNEGLQAQLAARPWNGNVRELRNAIEHAAVVARGRELAIEDFPESRPSKGRTPPSSASELAGAVRRWTVESIDDPDGNGAPSTVTLHADLLSMVEPTLFEVVLQHTAGNRAKAAEILGIHRGTLRERLKSYDLDSD